MKNLPLWCLCGLSSMPFLFPWHQYPMITFHAEWFTVVLALVFVLLVTLQTDNREINDRRDADPPGLPFIVIPFMLLAVLVLVRGYFLPYMQKPIIAASYITIACMVIIAVQHISHPTRRMCTNLHQSFGVEGVRYAVMVAVTLGGLAMALSGFMQHFKLSQHFMTGDVQGMVGVIGQRNTFAAYVACGMIALWHISGRNWLMLLLAPVLAAAEAYSGARISWVFIGLLAFMCTNRQQVAAWVLCAAAFLFIRFTTAADIVPGHAGAAAVEGMNIRYTLLIAAVRVWIENPLFGSGIGELAYQTYLHAQPYDNAGIDRHSHNLVAQLLAETGLVGFLIAWFAVSVFTAGVIMQATKLKDSRAILLILAVLLAYSFTEFPLWHAQFLVLAAIMVGLLPNIFIFGRVYDSLRAVMFFACVGGLMYALWIRDDYRTLEEFQAGNMSTLRLDSFFRPQLELALASVQTPQYDDRTRVLLERALHVFPTHTLLCILGTEEAEQRRKIIYGDHPCPVIP